MNNKKIGIQEMMEFFNDIKKDDSINLEVDEFLNQLNSRNFKFKIDKVGVLNLFTQKTTVKELDNIKVEENNYFYAFLGMLFLMIFQNKKFIKTMKVFKKSGNFIYKDGNYADEKILQNFNVISLEKLGFGKVAETNDEGTPKTIILFPKSVFSKKEQIKAILYILKKKKELIENIGTESVDNLITLKMIEILGL